MTLLPAIVLACLMGFALCSDQIRAQNVFLSSGSLGEGAQQPSSTRELRGLLGARISDADHGQSRHDNLERNVRSLESILDSNISENDRKDMAYHLGRFLLLIDRKIEYAEYEGTVFDRYMASQITAKFVQMLRLMAEILHQDGFKQNRNLGAHLRNVAERLSPDSIVSDCARSRILKQRVNRLVVLLAVGRSGVLSAQQISDLEAEARRLAERATSLSNAYGCDHLLLPK